jgi:hypothetical protein
VSATVVLLLKQLDTVDRESVSRSFSHLKDSDALVAGRKLASSMVLKQQLKRVRLSTHGGVVNCRPAKQVLGRNDVQLAGCNSQEA